MPRQRELMLFCDPKNKVRLACEQEQVKESGKGKREPVGMAKDFNFQMPAIFSNIEP